MFPLDSAAMPFLQSLAERGLGSIDMGAPTALAMEFFDFLLGSEGRVESTDGPLILIFSTAPGQSLSFLGHPSPCLASRVPFG
jgi:hypothetical protein